MSKGNQSCLAAAIWAVLAVVGASGVARGDDAGDFDRLALRCMAECATGQLARAERTAAELRRLAEGPLRDNPLRLAEAMGYQGHALTVLGRFVEAESLYTQMLAIGERLLPENHPKRSLGYQGLAYLYMLTARYEDAARYFERAVSIAEKVFGPNDVERGRSLGNLANVYVRQGRYAEAERLYKRALEIYEKALGPEVTPLNAAYLALGAIYGEQGRYGEAEQILERALESARKTPGEGSALQRSAMSRLATVYRLQGRYADAERLLRPKLNEIDLEHIGGALLLAELGLVCRLQGRYTEAEAFYQQALGTQERLLGPRHPEVASTLLGLAMVDASQGRASPAEEKLNRAIEILQRIGVNSRERWECHRSRGELFWQAGRRSDALQDLQKAMDLAEQQRAHASGGEVEQARSFAQYADVFEKMVAWQSQLGDIDQTLDAMERSRARSLLDQMAVRGIDLLAGLPDAEAEKLRSKERQAQLRVASVEKQLQLLEQDPGVPADRRSAQRERLQAELEVARRQFVEAYADIRNSSPAYRLAIARDRRPVRRTQLGPWLSKQEAILFEYLLGDESSHLLVIPGNGTPRLEKLSVGREEAATLGISPGPLTAARLGTALVNAQGTGLLQWLKQSRSAGEDREADGRLAALSRVLVPPAQRERLLEKKHRRIVIIPDGPLTQLPFETLVIGPNEGRRYLLDLDLPVLYAPSATVLVNLAQRETGSGDGSKEPVLTVGDCRYVQPADAAPRGGLAQLTARSRYGTASGRLAALPFCALEMQWVAETFARGTVRAAWLKGDLATEAALRFNAPGRRVLHFACHGLVDQSHGNLFGALALTPGPTPENPADDGFLTLAEIYQLNLKGCELAVLSACDTNVGPEQRGEGVWALSRGFLVAGARRVVASNWLVDDEAAASLISYFCAGVAQSEKEGKTPDYARALHDAKRWVRQQEKWKSPYYWGTFVLVGPN